MSANPQCANCFEAIQWKPVYTEGQPYCCDGCSIGGPCVCTYSGAPPRLDVRSILEAVGYDADALARELIVCANCFEEFRRNPHYLDDKPYCCEGCAYGGPCRCTYDDSPDEIDEASHQAEVELPLAEITMADAYEALLNETSHESLQENFQPVEVATDGEQIEAIEVEAVAEVQEVARPAEAEPNPVNGREFKAGALWASWGLNGESSKATRTVMKSNKYWDMCDAPDDAVAEEPHMRNANALWETQADAPATQEPDSGDGDVCAVDSPQQPTNQPVAQNSPDEVVNSVMHNIEKVSAATSDALVRQEFRPRDLQPVEEERPQTSKLLVTVSPLANVAELRSFNKNLESLPSVKNMILTHYGGDQAIFEIQDSFVNDVVKDIIEYGGPGIQTFNLTPGGLEVVLSSHRSDVASPTPAVESPTAVAVREYIDAKLGDLYTPPSEPHRDEPVNESHEINELHSFKFEMGVDVFFNGRHQVDMSGERGPIHMHSWRVQALLSGSSSEEHGGLRGTQEVKDLITSYVEQFNGRFLNKITPFDDIMPTSSNIARVIFEHSCNELGRNRGVLRAIRLWESPTSYVEYAGEEVDAL